MEDKAKYKTFWTARELANEIGVSDRYIRQLLQKNTIRGEKPGGRDWLIPDSEARRWLDEYRRRAEKGES